MNDGERRQLENVVLSLIQVFSEEMPEPEFDRAMTRWQKRAAEMGWTNLFSQRPSLQPGPEVLCVPDEPPPNEPPAPAQSPRLAWWRRWRWDR